MAKSLDEAEKLSLTNEDKEAIYFSRGAMFEKTKKIDQSEAEFRKILAINPNSASALNYLGYMWADRNVRLNEALDMIRKAVDQEPNNGAFLDSLGWVYFRLGKLSEAEEYLKKALDRSGKDPTVNDHLGDVYAKQGNWKLAAQQWEISVKLYHQGPVGDHDAGEVTKVQKKLDGAKVRLAKEKR
jgi:tetratricopeptide (TPR) repeat protein